jgi:hypothetical protein
MAADSSGTGCGATTARSGNRPGASLSSIVVEPRGDLGASCSWSPVCSDRHAPAPRLANRPVARLVRMGQPQLRGRPQCHRRGTSSGARMTRPPCWRSYLSSTIFGSGWSGRPIRSRPQCCVLALPAGHHSAQHGQGSGTTTRSLTRASRPTQRHRGTRPIRRVPRRARPFAHSPRSIRCGIFAGYSAFELRFNQAIGSGLVP